MRSRLLHILLISLVPFVGEPWLIHLEEVGMEIEIRSNRSTIIEVEETILNYSDNVQGEKERRRRLS